MRSERLFLFFPSPAPGQLREEGYGTQVEWLQLQLLEGCYARVYKLLGPDMPKPEPIPYHYTSKGLD